MRKNLVVGILRPAGEGESRAPLVPSDVNWLVERGVSVEVESSPERAFSDREYRSSGARVLDKFRKAAFLVGVKAPRVDELYEDRIYMVFPHVCKEQSPAMPFLRACLEKKITLIDHEKICDPCGRRLVYFGRFAGICGMVDSLHYLGRKLEWKGIKNPFSSIRPAREYGSLKAVKEAVEGVGRKVKRRGFEKKLCPFIIGITGHGNVSGGVQELLGSLDPVEISPRDIPRFIRHRKWMQNRVYKIVFLREEKFRSRSGRSFYSEEYLKYPGRFESNMDAYLPYLNVLVHGSYWDSRYPRMVTRKMVRNLAGKRPFRLEFIADVSCDVNGAVELTYRTTTPDDPTFTYLPGVNTFVDGYKAEGVTVLSVDNLPAELPRDSSREFSGLIRDYVYQIASHGVKDITRHAAVPAEIRRAVIAQDGKLAADFRYLGKYIRQKVPVVSHE